MTNKKICRFQFLLILIFLISSCSITIDSTKGKEGEDGEGVIKDNEVVIKENREVGGFDRLKNVRMSTVRIKKGKQNITVRCDSNIMPFLQTKVDQGELTIRIDTSIENAKKLQVTVPHEKLKKIENHGMGSIKSDDTLRSEEMSLINEGMGELHLNVITNTLNIRSEGQGDISLAGKTEEMDLQNKGMGEVTAYGLEANKVNCSNNGMGTVKVHANETLTATLEGMGNIYFKGSPSKKDLSADGMGDIESR